MHIVPVETDKQKKEYIDFVYTIYNGNRNFKDTLVGLVRDFLNKRDEFQKRCVTWPVKVASDGRTLCQCILIHAPGTTFMQMGFFESLPDQEEAVSLLLGYAAEKARFMHMQKIVIGLNGHLQYGLGFLLDSYDTPISFDSAYTQNYYIDYFSRIPAVRKTLSTYAFDTKTADYRTDRARRISGFFSVRIMDKRRFKRDMLILGSLCNRTLGSTYLYSEKSPMSFYQIMNKMKILLEPENVLFLTKDRLEVGFLFWHPDYNEVVPGGKRNSMLAVTVNCLFGKRRIRGCKINALGILPEHRRSGGLLLLFEKMRECVSSRYDYGETNFVWDANLDSSLLGTRRGTGKKRSYCVFEYTDFSAEKKANIGRSNERVE